MPKSTKEQITTAKADAKLYNRLGIDESYLRQHGLSPEAIRDKFFAKKGKNYVLKSPQQMLRGIQDDRAQHDILDAIDRYIGEQGRYVQRLVGTKLEAAYALQFLIQRYKKEGNRRELEEGLATLSDALRPRKKAEQTIPWGKGFFGGQKTRNLGDVVEEGLGKAAALILLAVAISYLGKASTSLTGAVIGAQPSGIGMLMAAGVAIASFYIILK